MLKITDETKERKEWEVGDLILRNGNIYMVIEECCCCGLVNLSNGKCITLGYSSVKGLQDFESQDVDKIVDGELIIK